MQRLPIDQQSFEVIREKRYLYVDKTQWIHRMTEEGQYYFLSRPRRFGKSLTVSTIRSLFLGKQELFNGLWIAEHGNWEWKEHPLILIDFNMVSHDTPENLKTGLGLRLTHTAKQYDIGSDTSLLKEQFYELILALYGKTGMPVVVLVDEYDKPVIDHLGKGEEALDIAKQNRDILKSFLGVLKGADVAPAVRFVFITGVSKFSQVSVFSELNNLIDLTMSEAYSDMLGYTQEEVERYFADHIARFAEKNSVSPSEITEKLKLKYDGYRFSEREIRVYNPFSVLRSLSNMKFGNYWFGTGTPTFLIALLKQGQYDLTGIEGMQVGEEIFSVYDLENLAAEALLFQTGYITVESVRGGSYTMNYPNLEVKAAFTEHLLMSCMTGRRNSGFLLLSEYLREENFDAFFQTMSAVFASVPYTLSAQKDEAYFHTIFYLMISASGADAGTEILTNRGRIDMALEFHDKIFIIEFKCNQSAEAGISQILARGYAEKFRIKGKKIILIGIGFNSEKRNIEDWKAQTL